MSVSRIVRTVVGRPRLPSEPARDNSGELEELRTTLDNVMGRVERLEEEREFFKDLLDAPRSGREIGPPGSKKES